MSNILISKRKNLQLLVLILTISILYHPTVSGLFQRWIKWDQALSHSLPTLGIIVYFLWQAKFVPRAQDSKWAKYTLYICLLFSSTVWASLQVNNIEILSELTLFFTIVIYIASCYSLGTSVNTLPILGLLLFTLPLLSELNDPLVFISSTVTGKLIALSNITALIEGNSISIPTGKIIIADGCSGLRYLTVSILLGYIICLLNNSNWKQIIYIMLSSVFIGLIANWLRIFILVLVGYQTNMQSSLMQDHETFGWILFSLIVGPALYFAPVNKKSAWLIPLPNATFIAPSIILIIGPLLLFFSDHQSEKPNPLKIDHLYSVGTELEMQPNTLASTGKQIAGNHASAIIELNTVKIYSELITSTAAQGEKLVPYIKSVFDKNSWRQIDSINLPPSSFSYLILKKFDSEQRRVFGYSFHVGSDTTSKYHTAKLLQLKARLVNEQYFGLIILEAECENTCEKEGKAISDLAIHWSKSPQ